MLFVLFVTKIFLKNCSPFVICLYTLFFLLMMLNLLQNLCIMLMVFIVRSKRLVLNNMETIRIRVFLSDSSPKPFFERIINLNAFVSIPYASLMNDFKFLFGNNVVVEFSFL